MALPPEAPCLSTAGTHCGDYGPSLRHQRKQETDEFLAQKKPSILDGIQVLDFSQVLSGPDCTRILADMGVEVIKIERPPTGDSVRNFPAIKEGLSGSFLQYNAGKKACA